MPRARVPGPRTQPPAPSPCQAVLIGAASESSGRPASCKGRPASPSPSPRHTAGLIYDSSALQQSVTAVLQTTFPLSVRGASAWSLFFLPVVAYGTCNGWW